MSKKSPEELFAIAKELKVKKPESIAKDELIYVILDEQAIQSNESPRPKKIRTKAKKVEKIDVEKIEAKPAESSPKRSTKVKTEPQAVKTEVVAT